MSSDCCPPCNVPVNVPGPEGVPGTNGNSGLNGGNAYTTTTANFVVPAQGSAVTVAVASTVWMQIGQVVFIPGAGNFIVTTIFGANSVSLTYAVDPENTNAGVTINAGAGVTPSGLNGTDGTNGSNGFTHTTVNFVVPALDGVVLVTVADTSFMFSGQFVNVVGAGVFLVTGVPTGTTVNLKYLNFVGNTNSGNTIIQPALVSPTNPGVVAPQSFYAAGAAYSLTNSSANVAIGAVNTQITLPEAGTWMLLSRVRYDYAAATFAGTEIVTTKLRRTNNTAADILNSSTAWRVQNITTLSYTAHVTETPPIFYTTANNNDVVELWGSVSAGPSAGALNAIEADIVAIWLHS